MGKYHEILRKYIESSPLSIKEILQKCKEEYGISVSRPYISNLINERFSPPSHEISRAIALVTGNDPEPLIIAALEEKANDIPEIKRILKFYIIFKDILDDLLKHLVKLALEEDSDPSLLTLKEKLDDDGFWAQMSIDRKLDLIRLLVFGDETVNIEIDYTTNDFNYLLSILKKKKPLRNIVSFLSDLDDDDLKTIESFVLLVKNKLTRQGIPKESLRNLIDVLAELSVRDYHLVLAFLEALNKYRHYL